jgi:acetyl esterase
MPAWLENNFIRVMRPIHRFLSHRAWKKHPIPDDIQVRDIIVALPGRTLRGKVFEPKHTSPADDEKKPLLLLFHGGGLGCGSVHTTHYASLATYASQLGCTVVGIDYRLAPEFPVPHGAQDAVDCTKWVLAKLQDQPNLFPHCTRGQVWVGGDDAGGLLSLVVASSVPNLAGVLLFYPNTHYDTGFYESWKNPTCKQQADLTKLFLRVALGGVDAPEFFEQYKDNDEVLSWIFPLLTPESQFKANMPPTFLVSCEHDVLLDEQVALQKKLERLGIRVEYHHYEKEEHGFMGTAGITENFTDCLTKVKSWMNGLKAKENSE